MDLIIHSKNSPSVKFLSCPAAKRKAYKTMDLVGFYLNRTPDDKARYIKEMHSFNNNQLENLHDYIQLLFPLPEQSRFNPNAPVLTKEIHETFLESPEIQTNILASINLMMDFYSIDLNYPTFTQPLNQLHYYSPLDHNYLRLTRILKFMKLMNYTVLHHKLLITITALVTTPFLPNMSKRTLDSNKSTLHHWLGTADYLPPWIQSETRSPIEVSHERSRLKPLKDD